MKKIFTMAVAMLLFAGNAMALSYEPKEGFSYLGFLGMNTTKITNSGYDGKIGGTAGFKIEYMLPKAHGTYLNAGVDWTQKGAKVDAFSGTFDGTDKFNLHYLEVPIHVGYRYNFSDEVGVYLDFGPYFGIGINGKHKFSADADGAAARAVEWSYSAFKKSTTRANFQRWDAGIGFRVGGEYNNHYNLILGCDWGITDMWRDDYRDAMYDAGFALDKVRNFNFTIAFGYRF